MNLDDILKLARKQPFEPFRIHQSDGEAFEVYHRNQIIIDRRTCYVGIQENKYGVFRRVAAISALNITHVEPCDPPERQSA